MAVDVVAFNHVANQKLPWEYPSRRGWFRRGHAFTSPLLCGAFAEELTPQGLTRASPSPAPSLLIQEAANCKPVVPTAAVTWVDVARTEARIESAAGIARISRARP